MLYGLSGIVGSERAMSLLEKFGSVRNAVLASEEELSTIKLWGPKTIKKWKRVVDSNFRRSDVR